jgi:hypothetical protein
MRLGAVNIDRWRRQAALALVGLCWVQVPLAVGQADQLLPEDHAVRQPDFFTFRAGLLRALARRDTVEVLKAVAPDIRNTFGDDNGSAAFRRLWRVEAPDSELWEELTAVLALGGTFESESTFVAPYVFSRWPSSYDAFGYLAVIGSGVRIRSAPDSKAAILGKVSLEVVRRGRASPPSSTTAGAEAWEPVQLGQGRVGYVARQFLRSPVDYRAYFVRRGGRWTMTTFIAGD